MSYIMIKQFKELVKLMSVDNHPVRLAQRENFIMNRMENIAHQNITQEQLTENIKSYLEYSPQGVANSLAFNNKIDKDIKTTAIEVLKENPIKYGFDSTFLNVNDSGMHIVHNEDLEPKIAILISNNDMRTAKAITFVDKSELDKLCKQECLDQCLNNFERKLDHVVDTVVQLSSSSDKAFETLFTKLDSEQIHQLTNLNQHFDIPAQLDKELRKPQSNNVIVDKCVDMLAKDDLLNGYINDRIKKHSTLNDNAKEKLLLAQERHLKKEPENIIEQDPKRHSIFSLSKEHETHFKKVELDADRHYWVNKEETIKIYPEKVTIPTVTRDSVALALDAGKYSHS